MTFLSGKKTYIVAAAMIAYALSAYILGKTPEFNLQLFLEALGLAALRSGVASLKRY